MYKVLGLLWVALSILTGCTTEFKPTDIAPQYLSSGSNTYVFTELTNYDRYTFRVFTWTVMPMNGKVKEDAADWLAKKFPGSSVYNESDAMVIISERQGIKKP
jgi:hypothetical protein